MIDTSHELSQLAAANQACSYHCQARVAGFHPHACSWPAAEPWAAAWSAASASRALALSATAALRRPSSARCRAMRRSSSRDSWPTCSSLHDSLKFNIYIGKG